MSILLGFLSLIPLRSDSPESASMPDIPQPSHTLHEDSTPEQNQNQNENTHEDTSTRH